MKRYFYLRMRNFLGVGVSVLLASTLAHANLGGNIASIDKDTVSMNAKHVRRAGTTAAYSVHEVSSDSHLVKEYVNASGVVFAVTWSGAVQPDLSTLFGDYYAEFRTQNRSAFRMRGKRQQSFKTANLTFENGGHMRSQHGRAILSAAVPASLSLGDIK